MRKLIIVAILFIVGGGAFIWLQKSGKATTGKLEGTAPELTTPDAGLDRSPDQSRPKLRQIDHSPFIEEYGKEGGSATRDLVALKATLQSVPMTIKDFDGYFLPDNKAIVAFMSGNNRDRLSWIPEGHPMINEDGELIDRWGSPIFFHRESATVFSLRSAGPDLILWNDDDVELPGTGLVD